MLAPLLGAVLALETPAHDPFAGLNPDGSIPKVALPEDIPNPERWRYVPEGRLVPGGPLDRIFVSSFIVPIIYFEEAVGAGGGIGLVDIDPYGSRRRDFLGVFLARSTEGQERYAVAWGHALRHRELPGGGIAVEEGAELRIAGGYERVRTARTFGLGPDSDRADESDYTDETAQIDAGVDLSLPQVWRPLRVRGGVRGETRSLGPGGVDDLPDLDTTFPELAAPADGVRTLWLTAGARVDSRDSIEHPYRGGMVGVDVNWAALQDGPEPDQLGGATVLWQAMGALAVPSPFHRGGSVDEENPPTDTIALALRLEHTLGELPFTALPTLGGPDTLRGYIEGRWRDRAAWHLGAEWRTWPLPRGVAFTDTIRLERIGVAPFVDLGNVAPRVADLPDATLRWSYGIGLRLGFERNAIYRIDWARSAEETAVTATFGTAF